MISRRALIAGLSACAATAAYSYDGAFPAGSWVTPEDFGADTDGDWTGALMRAHDQCWNGGNVRGGVLLLARRYNVTDHDGDGVALRWSAGVPLQGISGTASLIASDDRDIVILRRTADRAHRAPLRDFLIDGAGKARSCLEIHRGSSDEISNVKVQGARRPLVIDACQNMTLRNVISERGTEWNISVLNGAGSVTFDHCFASQGGKGHILIDNDASYEGWNLGPAKGEATVYAYRRPTLISFIGGVYERSISDESFLCSLRNNNGDQCLSNGGTEFWASQYAETVVDNGRHNFAAEARPDQTLWLADDITRAVRKGTKLCITVDSKDIFCTVASSSFGEGTKLEIDWEAGAKIASGTVRVQIGRSDDGDEWLPGQPSLLRLRDTYIFGGGLRGPAIRTGGWRTLVQSPLFLACLGDWIESSSSTKLVWPSGGLGPDSMRMRHIRGIAAGRADNDFTPFAAADREDPGQAN